MYCTRFGLALVLHRLKTRSGSRAAMAFPVVNTFIEFRLTRQARRTRSSPPEFQVHIAIAEASRKRRRGRRRQTQTEDDVFAEFAQRARWERWASLATTYVKAKRAEARRRTLQIIVAFKAARRVPVLQETIPLELFTHAAICLGICHVEFSMLVREGVLRREGATMQIWVSHDGLEAPRMKLLLRYSRLFKQIAIRGEFALTLPMDGGIACTPMSLGPEMTVIDLKAVAAVSSGIKKEKQRMTHLGSELVRGYLVDNGVRPGSCVRVSGILEI